MQYPSRIPISGPTAIGLWTDKHKKNSFAFQLSMMCPLPFEIGRIHFCIEHLSKFKTDDGVNQKCLFIHDLKVVEEECYRRKGVGKYLLTEAIEYGIRKLNLKNFVLYVLKDDLIVVNFYLKFGFKIQSEFLDENKKQKLIMIYEIN